MKIKVGWERSGREICVIGFYEIVVMNENGEIFFWFVCNEWLLEDFFFCISFVNFGVINWR